VQRQQRHDRQARLAEVGAEGQARIARSVVLVPGEGFAADVAVRYLAGAGVARLRVGSGALAETALAVDPAVEVEVDDGIAQR
jgi:molybdopterin/thiamine biosynthesis adenylyltransferase